ncbi:C2H2 type zinc-finger-domain-containing protein [Xylariales sp. AK1849]|nr:C2H2 type zinc-finger-domain-containing protein [Xylariales sp. AK1849]
MTSECPITPRTLSGASSAEASPPSPISDGHPSVETAGSARINDSVPIENTLSLLNLDQDDGVKQEEIERQFDPARCLFCNTSSADLEENLSHMSKRHGFLIPDQSHLVVDLETLVGYLHLVISGYFECLHCGSQRNNTQAAQQHMTGKGHCKLDLSSEDSEYRDFYEFDSGSEDSDAEGLERLQNKLAAVLIGDADHSVRLPSGKVLSQQSRGKRRQYRAPKSALVGTPGEKHGLEAGTPKDPPTASASAPAGLVTTIMTKGERQDATFVNQLASLRTEDRRSLMHLPMPQQRALIAKSKKQVERARRIENDMLLKIQLKGNKTAKR